MKWLLQRLPDGTLTASLTNEWGYRYTLTGTRTDAGYEVEVKLVAIPEDAWLPGDEAWFEAIK